MLSDTDQLKIVNIETEKFEVVPVVANVKIAKWHPRSSHKILVGTENGAIYLYNLETKVVEFEYSGNF